MKYLARPTRRSRTSLQSKSHAQMEGVRGGGGTRHVTRHLLARTVHNRQGADHERAPKLLRQYYLICSTPSKCFSLAVKHGRARLRQSLEPKGTWYRADGSMHWGKREELRTGVQTRTTYTSCGDYDLLSGLISGAPEGQDTRGPKRVRVGDP